MTTQNPYRISGALNTSVDVKLEKSVADAIRVMSEHTKIPVNELVNTAMKRFIATHGDYFPKTKK